MVLVLLAVIAGVLIGYAAGGRLTRLTSRPPVRNRLLLTAAGLYVLGVLCGWVWSPLLPTLCALSGAALAHYAWLNRGHRGAGLVAAGFALNALVLLVNGAVPVSETAAARAGAEATAVGIGVETTTESARLPWLGKVVPVAFPPRPEVVSPGDVAIAAGLALVIVTGLRGARSGSARTATSAEPASGLPVAAS